MATTLTPTDAFDAVVAAATAVPELKVALRAANDDTLIRLAEKITDITGTVDPAAISAALLVDGDAVDAIRQAFTQLPLTSGKSKVTVGQLWSAMAARGHGWQGVLHYAIIILSLIAIGVCLTIGTIDAATAAGGWFIAIGQQLFGLYLELFRKTFGLSGSTAPPITPTPVAKATPR